MKYNPLQSVLSVFLYLCTCKNSLKYVSVLKIVRKLDLINLRPTSAAATNQGLWSYYPCLAPGGGKGSRTLGTRLLLFLFTFSTFYLFYSVEQLKPLPLMFSVKTERRTDEIGWGNLRWTSIQGE